MQHQPDTEIWDCQGGPVIVETDGNGCPLEDRFCKVQVGPQAGPVSVAAGAAADIPIAISDFTWAKVKGLVMEAVDPVLGGLPGSQLEFIGVTAIKIQGIENTDGEVPATRYRQDATGAGPRGTGQAYRGTLGSAGGAATISVINRGSTTLLVGAAFDVNAVR